MMHSLIFTMLPMISFFIFSNIASYTFTLSLLLWTTFSLVFMSPSISLAASPLSTHVMAVTVPLILLTIVLILLVSLSLKTSSLQTNLMLILVAIMLFFSASTFLSLFLAFETSALLIFFMIIGWGYQPERLDAALSLMLYTFSGGIPLLICIYFVLQHWSFVRLPNMKMAEASSQVLILSFAASAAFLAKFPIFGLHGWLPQAHVEASAGGSMILAGILLKMGGFGMMVFSPMISATWASFVIPWATGGGLAASFICVRQTDSKVLIAYSSVAHMSFCLAPLCTKTLLSLNLTLMIMLSHGIISSALFFCVGEFYSQTASRQLWLTRNLLTVAPLLVWLWASSLIISGGTPPFPNFWGEFFSLVSITSYLPEVSPVVLLSYFLGTAYSFLLLGSIRNGSTDGLSPVRRLLDQTTQTLLFHMLFVLILLFLFPTCF